MITNLKSGERLDDLQINGYEIIQHPGRFCFGMDAVLLSAFVRAGGQEHVLDLCTGTGILPLLLEAKGKGGRFCGIEVQKESADMAARSVAHNGLTDKIRIITGDIKEADDYFEPASFDVVTVNPPYMTEHHGLKNPDSEKAIARHEILCTLSDVLTAGSRMLKEKGRFYMVHRPFRLTEILTGMHACRLEPKRIRFVHPYQDREPNMVLIEGMKGANARTTVEPPLIVFNQDRSYTDEVAELYGR